MSVFCLQRSATPNLIAVVFHRQIPAVPQILVRIRVYTRSLCGECAPLDLGQIYDPVQKWSNFSPSASDPINFLEYRHNHGIRESVGVIQQ